MASKAWKPSPSLLDSLEMAGVDSDILNSLLESTLEPESKAHQAVAPLEFVSTVITEHIAWGISLDEQPLGETEGIPPKTILKKSWKPKEHTIRLLVEELNQDRTEIGFLREEFKKLNAGALFRYWDCLFIQFAINNMVLETKGNRASTQATDIPNKNEFEISDLQRFKNIYYINSIVSDLLKNKYVSNYFRNPLDSNWTPSPWAVRKISRINIKGRFINVNFIYQNHILKPFISYYQQKGGLFDNYNVLYYYWILERFHKNYRLLELQRINAERETENTKIP
ncbi:hypothetical protein [Marinimicrobium agarilyticum]|uniref:hypothetical protein n=1 Tax=Marinimicrobium agarilyticum TaxID=306546 RepID=UPI000485822B|nr:hypothetical protein [Marinimicrobium agarilyticum]